jgi:haloalkane dehalogenase
MVTAAFPFADRRVPIAGFNIHYVDEGAGPPVVMVHGNPTWSYLYRGLIAALAPTNRALAPDHIGCGRSDKPGRDRYPYTLARRVDDFSAWMDAVCPDERVRLVVHDWGGMIGLAWATHHWRRVEKLVAMNTAAFPLPAGKRVPWQIRLGRNAVLGPLLIRGLNLFCRGAARGCVVRRPLDAEVRRQFLAPYGSWADRVAVDQFVRTIPLTPADPGYDIVAQTADGLANLRHVPVFLPWGLRDFVFDGDYLSEWLALADAGHYLLEDAGDEVIPAIVHFLNA